MTGDPDPTEYLDGPLPEPIRARVLALASDGLGALSSDEIPASLRPFARFAPSRRAKLAATPIAAALESDQEFRERVADRLRAGAPALAEALDAGTAPAAADPLDVAAAAYLLRPEGWISLIAAAMTEVDRVTSAAGSAQATQAVTRLQEQLAAARTAARADLDRLRRDLDAVKKENTELRHRLRESRESTRRSEREAEAALRAAEDARSAAAAAVAAAEGELRRMRGKVDAAEAALEAARRAAREGRSAGDVRLRLLLDTVVEASQGLRRELALPPIDTRPADTVPAVAPAALGTNDVASRALAGDDPGVLDQLLALPQAHLVVDGYNVTKTGYGGLTLEDQRGRLLSGLGGLAARCGAEVTCVFDGAALDTPAPVAAPRGVRVLFSSPGETADELIRELVRAEPPGRPLVVVSSDREVADSVRDAGARPVPSTMLLRRLERG